MIKEESLKAIVDEIFAFDSPKIEEEYKAQILDIITVAINGDEINNYLVIDVIVSGEDGIVAYVLTNARLVQFRINTKGEIKSTSFPLANMAGVEWSATSDGKREVQISGLPVGFRYNPSKTNITDFFQKTEQALIKERSQKELPHGG